MSIETDFREEKIKKSKTSLHLFNGKHKHKTEDMYTCKSVQRLKPEREMDRAYPSDKVGRSDKALGAPKRIIEVGTVAFELGGKATIDDGVATTVLEEIRHERGLLDTTSRDHFGEMKRVVLRM